MLELEKSGHYRAARACSRGRVRVPGGPGLALDLDALWAELDEAEGEHRQRGGGAG